MRLRAELLPEAQRAKFIHDLKEMEDLVGSSLDLFAELGKSRERYPVDINALLESIITDWVTPVPPSSWPARPTPPTPPNPPCSSGPSTTSSPTASVTATGWK